MIKKFIEKAAVKLNCPNCSKKIDYAFVCKMESFIGTRYAFFCECCQKLIGITNKNNSALLSPVRQNNNRYYN